MVSIWNLILNLEISCLQSLQQFWNQSYNQPTNQILLVSECRVDLFTPKGRITTIEAFISALSQLLQSVWNSICSICITIRPNPSDYHVSCYPRPADACAVAAEVTGRRRRLLTCTADSCSARYNSPTNPHRAHRTTTPV